MKFEYAVYVVTDSFGNKTAVVSEEPCDCVHVCGMRGFNGQDIFFETEAYHLDKWCENNGLILEIRKKSEKL
jgi:hypothetical protein